MILFLFLFLYRFRAIILPPCALIVSFPPRRHNRTASGFCWSIHILVTFPSFLATPPGVGKLWPGSTNPPPLRRQIPPSCWRGSNLPHGARCKSFYILRSKQFGPSESELQYKLDWEINERGWSFPEGVYILYICQRYSNKTRGHTDFF